MASADDTINQLTTDALRPKKVRTETADVERHSLPDQIAAAKFLLGQAAASKNKLGIRFRRFKPPGMIPDLPSTDSSSADVGF